MAFYDRDLIDELMSVIPVDQIIEATGYTIKGRGNNPGTDCPKCGRDHTHMKWNRVKKMFQCKSSACGFSGNIFQWVMEIKGMTFPEAVEWIADLSHFELRANSDGWTKMPMILKDAAQFCFNNKSKAWQYYNLRGISDKTLYQAGVGYAPGGRLLKEFLETKGYDKEELLSLRILYQNRNGGVLDGIYKQTVIPILDDKKRVIDLYCRAIDDTHSIKHFYLNGTRKILGAHLLTKGCKVVFVEGPADYLAYLEQYLLGRSHYVPLCTGKAEIQYYHVSLLLKYKVSEALIAYDADEAGQAGALQGGELLQKHVPANIFVASFMNGEDPASQYQKYQCINPVNVSPFIEFKWSVQLSEMPMDFILNFTQKNAYEKL